MTTRMNGTVDSEAAYRALIDLVADLAWAERDGGHAPQLLRAREEAMTLLTRVERGDRAASERAMELVAVARAAGGSARR